MSGQLDVIRRYYDACNAADAEAIAATMVGDFVHYFLAPNRGSRARRGSAASAGSPCSSSRTTRSSRPASATASCG